MVSLSCLNCKKIFFVKKYRTNTAKYCSRSCGALFVRVKIIRPCEFCNKIFEHISSRSNKAKYCSRKCYYKSLVGRGSVKHTCQYCEKAFYDSPSRNRKFCSKSCTGKGNHKEFKPVFTTVRKAMIKKGLINSCVECGYNTVPDILGVHHVDGNRHNNSLENLKVLCPMCHSLAHHKHICH
jgi:hypothetical protein